MKCRNFYFLVVIGTVLSLNSCNKDTTEASGSLYVPVAADATATASLADLQKGRELYAANCNACHGLYSPDDYSVTSWTTVLSNMVPRTNLSQSEAVLVSKYVKRGK